MTRNQSLQPIANTIVDAAKRLGVGRTTIYELIGTRQLRTFKVGTRTLIPESELARFVQVRMEASASSAQASGDSGTRY